MISENFWIVLSRWWKIILGCTKNQFRKFRHIFETWNITLGLSVPFYTYCPTTYHICWYGWGGLKSQFNCEFLLFWIHFWCKSHLFFMEISNLKKFLARAESSEIREKMAIFPHFETCSSARSARGNARAPNFFSDSDSSWNVDDFCTINECNNSNIRN